MKMIKKKKNLKQKKVLNLKNKKNKRRRKIFFLLKMFINKKTLLEKIMYTYFLNSVTSNPLIHSSINIFITHIIFI